MSGHGNTETQVKLPELTQGKYRRRLDVVVVVATFGGILFGYDTGVINGALEPMKAELGLTVFTEGVVPPRCSSRRPSAPPSSARRLIASDAARCSSFWRGSSSPERRRAWSPQIWPSWSRAESRLASPLAAPP